MKTLIEFNASKHHLEGGTPDYFHNCGLFWILEHINWEIANIHFEVLYKTLHVCRASFSDACQLCHSLTVIMTRSEKSRLPRTQQQDTLFTIKQ